MSLQFWIMLLLFWPSDDHVSLSLAHCSSASFLFREASMNQDLVGLETLLIDQDRDEAIPDIL